MCVCVCVCTCVRMCMHVCMHVWMCKTQREQETDRLSCAAADFHLWIIAYAMFFVEFLMKIMPMTVVPGRSGARPGLALHGRAGSHQETGVNGWLRLTGLRWASEPGGMSALCLAETTLRACIASGTFLQTLPELVTPSKGLSLSLFSCPHGSYKRMPDIIWFVGYKTYAIWAPTKCSLADSFLRPMA